MDNQNVFPIFHKTQVTIYTDLVGLYFPNVSSLESLDSSSSEILMRCSEILATTFVRHWRDPQEEISHNRQSQTTRRVA